MSNYENSLLLLLLILSACCISHGSAAATSEKQKSSKLYIVYMGDKHHEDPNVVASFHHETLASLLGSKDAALSSMVYSYRHGFSGFAAMLTDSQAKRVAKMPRVLHVQRSGNIKPATTRSWDFLHLGDNRIPSPLLERSNYGEDVIVGVIDSGIWPESKSFNDDGYGPIPKRWKGVCQSGEDFNSSHCNRKLIGARFYDAGVPPEYLAVDYVSPRDTIDHGTHVASIAVGSYVENANYSDLGTGLARGGAPRARLAMYKVAWGNETLVTGKTASLLKAVDDAIHDNVDVLCLSLVVEEESFGTLHAVKRGITVVYAAGNFGPAPSTVANMSPWVITVAATTTDRSFATIITLGDNQTFVGQSIFSPTSVDIHNGFHTLVHGVSCGEKDLNETEVKGNYVLCIMNITKDIGADGQMVNAVVGVAKAGGIGLIFAQYPTSVLVSSTVPYFKVDFEIHRHILQYVLTASNPVVRINPTVTVEGKEGVLAPSVASFSSRGPSSVFPGVLKPDIAAPGYNILAAAKDSYKFKTGTSMATPHVSGIVALLKAIHPDWSPAAIKSAIVTTAYQSHGNGVPIMAEGIPRKVADPFDYGGGQIDPVRAGDPGLVYDIDPNDYDEFHCTWVPYLLCEKPENPVYHLNLPSISIPSLIQSQQVSRTVTNVGPVSSVYQLSFENPSGVVMEVQPPDVLRFDADNRRQTFTVTFRPVRAVQGVFTFGSITWYNERFRVRIPVAVRVLVRESFSDAR